MKKQLEKYIESLGAVKCNHYNFTHTLKTRIGLLYLKVDTEGSTFALFGNFLDDVDTARAELGHWKYNLHLWPAPATQIKEAIELHLNFVL